MVARSSRGGSLLIGIGAIGVGILGILGMFGFFGSFRAAGLFGWMALIVGIYGTGQAASGFGRPSQLVLAADGFEWTPQWRGAPVRRSWQEWEGPATAWRGTPTPRFGKRQTIGARYSAITPNELVVLMNSYRDWALQQAR